MVSFFQRVWEFFGFIRNWKNREDTSNATTSTDKVNTKKELIISQETSHLPELVGQRGQQVIEMTCKGVSLKFILREFKNKIINIQPIQQRRHYDPNSTEEYVSIKDAVMKVIKPYCETSQQSVLEIWEQKQESTLLVQNPANVFISHSWTYDIKYVITLLEQLLEEEIAKGKDDLFIWMDIFCINQFLIHSLPQDFFSTGFHNNIAKIGRTVAIFMPWRSPFNLKRGWCLWEIFGTINKGVKLEIRLGENEYNDFVYTLRKDFHSIMMHLSDIDVRKAEAHSPEDLKMIQDAIEHSHWGSSGVNQVIMDFMRSWIATSGKDSIQRMRNDPEINCKKSASFAELCNNVGQLLQDHGNFNEAEPLLRECLKITQAINGKMHSETATAMNNVAELLRNKGKLHEAEKLYRKALKIDVQVYGENHADVATDLNNLAQVLRAQNKLDEAESLFRQSLEIRIRTVGKTHPHFAQSLNNLGVLYTTRGKYDQAEPLFRRALDIRKTIYGENHPAVATSLHNLADILEKTGRHDEARRLGRQAYLISKDVLGENHPDTINQKYWETF